MSPVMVRKTPKLMVVGHARHGKDTVAEMLVRMFNLTFIGTSMICAKTIMLPAFAAKGIDHSYDSAEECFDDRGNHRVFWYDTICQYNSPDKAKLGRAVYRACDVYSGVRDWRELVAIKNEGLCDLIIWVDRTDHLPPEGEGSMRVKPWMADCILDNNGTLDDLQANLINLMYNKFGWEPNISIGEATVNGK